MKNEMTNFWKDHNIRVDTGEAVGRKMPQEGYNPLEDPNNKETLIKIAELIKVLAEGYTSLKEGFIFFGSRMRGSYSSNSDFDIIVPMKADNGKLCATLSKDVSACLSRKVHVSWLYPDAQLYRDLRCANGMGIEKWITMLAYLYTGIAFGKTSWNLQDEVLKVVAELKQEESDLFLNKWFEIESSRSNLDRHRTYAHLGQPPTMEDFLAEMGRRRRMAQQFMAENNIQFD